MMERLKRFAPPGMDLFRLRLLNAVALAVSIVFSMGFLISYSQELSELKRNMEYPVYAGLSITPFRDLIEVPMIVFRIAFFLPLLNLPDLYGYFVQDAKSIYVMKRLRNAGELHLRCLTLPLLSMLLMAAAGVTVYLLYYLIYMTCTPEILLPANL